MLFVIFLNNLVCFTVLKIKKVIHICIKNIYQCISKKYCIIIQVGGKKMILYSINTLLIIVTLYEKIVDLNLGLELVVLIDFFQLISNLRPKIRK